MLQICNIRNMKLFKTLHITSFVFLFLLAVSPRAFAAAPDGLGPWADKVISVHQGLMKNGLAVPAIRSNPLAALGVAENTPMVDSTFYSLGFGGQITLGFKNGIKNGVVSVEATNLPYPDEKAKIEVSPDKKHWYVSGTVTRTGQVKVPSHAGCIHYVRITDISNPIDFSNDTADGYDVDGVKGIGERCTFKYTDRHDNDDDHHDNHKDDSGKDRDNHGSCGAKEEKDINNGD
jgi:hypothetical protein